MMHIGGDDVCRLAASEGPGGEVHDFHATGLRATFFAVAVAVCYGPCGAVSDDFDPLIRYALRRQNRFYGQGDIVCVFLG